SLPLVVVVLQTYSSHDGFRFDDALRFLRECDALAFVGTSIAVSYPIRALLTAQLRQVPVFSFNLQPMETVEGIVPLVVEHWLLETRNRPEDELLQRARQPLDLSGIKNVFGSVDETLPALAQHAGLAVHA